jgi:hypothetical protein
MDSSFWTAVVLTLIPVVGGGVGYLIKFIIDFRIENRSDHDIVMEAIKGLKTDVKDVKDDLHEHVSWHLRRVKK